MEETRLLSSYVDTALITIITIGLILIILYALMAVYYSIKDKISIRIKRKKFKVKDVREAELKNNDI